MVNITHKSNTLRKAVAIAMVKVSSQDTIDAILEKKVPKGDVFEFARVAGLFAVKKTSDVIPDCHPLPVEYTAITYAVEGLHIVIRVEVHTIYKTGVEVEAMHGAAVTALTLYDMLKPIDKKIEIEHIRLEHKSGGKSQYPAVTGHALSCAVIVCSDSVSAAEKQDRSGKAIISRLEQFKQETNHYDVIPDEFEKIQQKVLELVEKDFDLVLFTGGTGLSARDVTPDAIRPLLDTEIPGIMETARNYGQERMPYAMFSRGVAGFIKQTLVITLPGSVKGAEESIDALFPAVLHVFKVREGAGHE
ncbi:bifunctional molybdenum cofactor biosynthesis protein MoaC/MoaB [Pedobacter sp. AW31-3R]|uniref:bifunctional molybdenum cofactor biosynthesis protein MoaC/MoaB n=1 Tax=Pedobacter sp. AW31-3R TaxID=3445781 RepID=UPI003FA15A7B